jgi:hypothetical protein
MRGLFFNWPVRDGTARMNFVQNTLAVSGIKAARCLEFGL